MATDSKSKTDKKRLRMNSSTSEDNEENAAFAELLQRITLIEQQAAKRDARISQVETQLAEANLEIKELKSKTNDLQRSLEYTQKDQEDAFDRIAECEQEQALHDDELIRQEIYSRRWNMIFYKVPESLDEDCTSVIRAVHTNDLKIDGEEVNGFKFCGVRRLGKQSRGRPRPIIARFTSRSDRDKVWKMRRNLKGSIVKIGEDLPKRVQDIRKNILIPAMKKAVVIILHLLTQINPYSPPIIPVISFVICHKIFAVYFLSFILYSFFQKSLKKYFLNNIKNQKNDEDRLVASHISGYLSLHIFPKYFHNRN